MHSARFLSCFLFRSMALGLLLVLCTGAAAAQGMAQSSAPVAKQGASQFETRLTHEQGAADLCAFAVDRTSARSGGADLRPTETANLFPAGTAATSVLLPPPGSGWLKQLLMSIATLSSAACLLWFCTPSRAVQAGSHPAPPGRVRTSSRPKPCAPRSRWWMEMIRRG